MIAYVLLKRLDRRMLLNIGWLQGVFICTLVFAGYCAIYVITPMDLEWHFEFLCAKALSAPLAGFSFTGWPDRVREPTNRNSQVADSFSIVLFVPFCG